MESGLRIALKYLIKLTEQITKIIKIWGVQMILNLFTNENRFKEAHQ